MAAPKILTKACLNTIRQLEASSNYTYITYQDGHRELSSYCLKIFADFFQKKQFIRINRSMLVHRSFVKNYLKADGKEYLTLKNNEKVAIPRRRTERLKTEFPALFAK